MKKAGLISKYWIILASIWCTLIYSLDILIFYRFKFRNIREDVGIFAWANRMLHLVRLTYSVYNPYKVNLNPNKPCIIMSNHSSLYDVLICLAAFKGSMGVLAKKELELPIWGRAMRRVGALYIDRENYRDVVKCFKLAKEMMKNKKVLWLSPEGTRSKDGALLPFKEGGFILAQQVGAIIIPVGLRGVNNILKPGSLNFYLNGKVEVHIGKPIDSSRYTNSQRSILMQDVSNAISCAMGLKLCM